MITVMKSTKKKMRFLPSAMPPKSGAKPKPAKDVEKKPLSKKAIPSKKMKATKAKPTPKKPPAKKKRGPVAVIKETPEPQPLAKRPAKSALTPVAQRPAPLPLPEPQAMAQDPDDRDEDVEEVAPPKAPVEVPQAEHAIYEIKHDLKKRVDLYLRDRIPDLSRAALQKLIKTGNVQVNQRIAKSSTNLRSGDTVHVTFTRTVAPDSVAEYIPLNIVYEDDQFIAINKQAKLIVHPARGHWTGTLINGLLWHAQETHSTLSAGSDPWRPGIIHRLDRDTTGLILVAKTDEAHWRIAGQFERRTIKKMYIAIVHGEMELENDLIDAPLAVHAKQREKYAVRTDIGKPAQTMYHVAERFKGYTLLHLHPKTGRTHQLRVHCAHIGHPIVGDTMYGGKHITLRDIIGDGRGGQTEANPDWQKPLIDRQALHAHQLRFVHPTQFHRMALEAPLPPDMEHILQLLRKWRKA